MSATITTYPKKVIDSEALQVSRWQAIWNNLIYKLQRKDFLITSVAGDGSSPEVAVLTVTGTLPTVTEGGTVYVNAGEYVGNYTVISATSGTITIDVEFGATATGYVNLITDRPLYYLEVDIQQKSGATYTSYATDKRVADSTGLITLDIASYVRSILNMDNDQPYTSRAWPDPNASAIVNIIFKEHWTGSDEAWSTVDEDEDYYIINSAMQKLNTYGSNQGEWVPFPPDLVSPPIEQHKGKFLTEFTKPTYWEGYPFDLSFIYPKDFEDSAVRMSVVEELYNLNRVLQSSDDDVIDEDTNSVVRLMLNGSYASTIKEVDVYLKAKAMSGGNDPGVIFFVSNDGNEGKLLYYGTKTIGVADWTTNFTTTMQLLAQSVNDSVAYGTIFGGHPSFDNSAGFSATYTVTDANNGFITVAAPVGSGTTYNGVTMYYYGQYYGSSSLSFMFGTDGEYEDLEGLTTARVTEVKTIKIGDVCDNPVYLRWANKYGGYSYWLFQHVQQESITSKIDATLNKYTEDISEQYTDQDIITISSGKDITVGADNLLTEDVEGLVGLKQSARVQMLVDIDNNIWQTVIIKPGTMQLPDTDAVMGDVRFTLQLADDNLPGQ